MWTPKRIVLLSLCFLTFSAFYLGYAYTGVGRIDGLPPLPEIYWPPKEREGAKVGADRMEFTSQIVARIREAFGPDAPELDRAQRPIRLTMPKKNIVLAAGSFDIRDGGITLNKVSLAMFGKERKDQPAEITTLRAAIAHITFDRPITTFTEIGSRKVVGAELKGAVDEPIVLNNNRRRAQRDQDLRVEFKTGPVYYDDTTHKIWTHSVVHLDDHRSKPKPHTVTGTGLEMELLAETPPQSGNRKPQREMVSGVKWLELKSGVQMKVYLDGKNGFLSGDPGKNSTPSGKAGERSELTIKTPGKFRYDIHKDHDIARFEALSADGARTPGMPPHVEVVRYHVKEKKRDQLICHQLTLRLRRKDNKSAKHSTSDGENVDIETAHAVSTGTGRYVTITSDSDELSVEKSNEVQYDSIKQRTTLKAHTGRVEVTYKDDTKIHARELEIQDHKPTPPPGWRPGQPLPPSARPYQTVRAKGPGWVQLVEKNENVESDKKAEKTEPKKRHLRAEWNEWLITEKDGTQDVLTLTGRARFLDEQADQNLQADQLKVWLDGSEEKKSQPASGISGSRKPRHVEATGNVIARSKEMNIHDTGKLIVRFVDVPAQKHLPPGAQWPPPRVDKRPIVAPVPKSEPLPPRVPKEMPRGPEQPATVTAQPTSRTGLKGPILGPTESEKQRPFDLTARVVDARIERSPVKNALDELWCEGQVRVKQEPPQPQPNQPQVRGTDIKGQSLQMSAGPDGCYRLVVYGARSSTVDGDDLAELTTDKIQIFGPEVHIDQIEDKAWVVGAGATRMDSTTSFQGDRLKEPVPLIIHWEKSMLFNGQGAEFWGNIQATQQTSRLASQHLLVTFDRTVTLKPGKRAEQPARVKKLVCDKDVRIEDVTRDPNDERRIVKYQSLQAPVMFMDALDPDEDRHPDPKIKPKQGNKVTASGPGTLRVWEQGSPEMDPNEGNEKRTTAKPKEGVWKMTLVSFRHRMDANSQTRTANFWEKVQVLSLPWPRHDAPLDLDMMLLQELPEGALYLRCDRLKVLDSLTDGKPNKQMTGNGNVLAQGKEFHAHALSVTYNQQKQQVILMGTKDNPATLTRQKHQGSPKETASGIKITYNRATGRVEVLGSDQVQGSTLPAAGPKK